MSKPRGIVLPPATALALHGGATQFRMPVKPQPDESLSADEMRCRMYAPTKIDRNGEEYPGPDVFGFAGSEQGWPCPYPPGTLVFVKEKWRPFWHPELFCSINYAADSSYKKPKISNEDRGFRFADMCERSGDNAEPWHSPMHMWPEFARTWLTVQGVTVERHDGAWLWCYTAARAEKPTGAAT